MPKVQNEYPRTINIDDLLMGFLRKTNESLGDQTMFPCIKYSSSIVLLMVFSTIKYFFLIVRLLFYSLKYEDFLFASFFPTLFHVTTE